MAQFQIKKPQAQTLQQKMGFVDSDLTTPGHDAIMLWLDDMTTSEQLGTWLGIHDWNNHEYKEKQWAKKIENFIENKKYAIKNRHFNPVDIEKELRDIDEAEHQITIPPKPQWPGLALERKQWEMPVMSGTYTIGFIDFVAYYTAPILTAGRPDYVEIPLWHINYLPRSMRSMPVHKAYFEVKTSIPSLGEILRQLALYREHLQREEAAEVSRYPSEYYRECLGQTEITINPQIFVVSPDTRFAAKIREQGYGFIRYEPEYNTKGAS